MSVDWTKPIQTVDGIPARLLAGVSLVGRFPRAVAYGVTMEYIQTAREDGTSDGQACIVNVPEPVPMDKWRPKAGQRFYFISSNDAAPWELGSDQAIAPEKEMYGRNAFPDIDTAIAASDEISAVLFRHNSAAARGVDPGPSDGELLAVYEQSVRNVAAMRKPSPSWVLVEDGIIKGSERQPDNVTYFPTVREAVVAWIKGRE